MAERITFECPECSAKLSVTDRSKLGKKVKCPKCQNVFAPDLPEEDEDELVESDIDTSQLFDDDDEDDDAPAAKGRKAGETSSKSRPASKKKSGSSNQSNTGLIIGIAVGAVVLIGGGLAFSGIFGGKSTPAPAPAVAVTTPNPEPAAATPATAPAATPDADAAKAAAPPAAPAVPPVANAAPSSTVQGTSSTSMSPVEKTLCLRWMPSDTESIMHVKQSELISAPLVKSITAQTGITTSADMFSNMLKIAPTEIESVTVGYSNLAESISKSVGMEPGTLPDPSAPPLFRQVGVIRVKKKGDWKQVLSAVDGFAAKEHQGKSYFESPVSPLMPLSMGWYPADPNTVVFGTVKELQSAIVRGETVIPRKEFLGLVHTPQIVLASVIPKLEGNPHFAAFEANPYFQQVKTQIAASALQFASMGLSIKGGFDLQFHGTCGTDEGAKKLKADFEGHLAAVRAILEMTKSSTPPLLNELADQILKNARVDEKSRTVKVSTNLPDSVQAKLEQVPPLLMIMAMNFNFGGQPGATSAGVAVPDGAKQPGETRPVPPTKSEGLGEGMEITAKAAWSPVTVIGPDGKPSIGMDLIVDLTSPTIETICAGGGIFATTIALQGGGTLQTSKLIGTPSSLSEMPLFAFDGTEEFSLTHPPKTLRLRLPVEPPAPDARIVDVFEGAIKILVAEQSHSVSIEEVHKAAGRPLVGDVYKSTDLRLRRSHSNVKPATLTVSCPKEHYIGHISIMPGNTASLAQTVDDRNGWVITSVEKDGQFLDDSKMEFRIGTNVKEEVISFRFEKIILPGLESMPRVIVPSVVPPAETAKATTPPASMTPGVKGQPGPPTLGIGGRRRRDGEDDD